MLKTETRTIKDAEYTTTTFPGRPGFKVRTRLLNLLGPALSGIDDLAGDKAAQMAAVARALGALLTGMEAEKTLQLILDLFRHTTRKDPESGNVEAISKDPVFDRVYAANYGEMLSVAMFVIDINNFFGEGGIGDLMDRAQEFASRLNSEDSSQTQSQQDSSQS
jgi:hypothetical protein